MSLIWWSTSWFLAANWPRSTQSKWSLLQSISTLKVKYLNISQKSTAENYIESLNDQNPVGCILPAQKEIFIISKDFLLQFWGTWDFISLHTSHTYAEIKKKENFNQKQPTLLYRRNCAIGFLPVKINQVGCF